MGSIIKALERNQNLSLSFIIVLLLTMLTFSTAAFAQAGGGSTCTLSQSKYGIPTWYKYLEGRPSPLDGDCILVGNFKIEKVSSLLGIGVAVAEILLFFAGIIAVGFIIYGGFRYMISQGEPENTKIAKDSVLNAVIGLIIAILASGIVRFIGSNLVR